MFSVFIKTNCRMISGQHGIVRSMTTSVCPKLENDTGSGIVKDYESIPGMSPFQLVRAFAPGGKLYNAGLHEMHKQVSKDKLQREFYYKILSDRKLRDEYGDIYKIPAMFGNREIVTVFSADDAEKVFRCEGKFPNRLGLETLHYYRKTVRPDIYGEYGSLASEQNEEWYKMRTLVNPVLMKPGIVRQYIPQVDEISKEFINLVLNLRDENSEVPADFGTYLNMWSLESITNISINSRLGLLGTDVSDGKGKELIQLARRYFDLGESFETKPPIWKIYATKSFKEMMSILDGITNIIIDLVDKAIKDLESSPNRDRDESILEKLVKINKKVAVVMCSDALIAGIDTTSAVTIGILYCLAKNQDKQDKLREELRQTITDPSEVLSVENMANMPYLRAVIKESMRLFPPAFGTVRRIIDDVELCGHRVPKGTDVLMILMLSHKSDEYFDQPNQFIPERWLKNPSEQCPMIKKSHPFAFLPFGFGARMCSGKRIAEMEMEVLVTRLIRDYKVEWNYPDMKIKSALINLPVSDLKFKITKL